MICYLNRGLIIEQALVHIVKRYFARLRLDSLYQNFHISITNDHPFAHLVIHPDSANTADIFPAIVISSESDSKSPEMRNVPAQTSSLEITSAEDIDILTDFKIPKTIIDEETGIEKTVTKKGETVYETLPGVCMVAEQSVIDALKKTVEKEKLYGLLFTNRRRDHISIEIWSENNQLKNELYEQLRIYLEASGKAAFEKIYKDFDVAVFDTDLNGQRSNNYNVDFDVPLYGSNLTFDVEYTVNQILIDSDIVEISEIIPEVTNYVKKN